MKTLKSFFMTAACFAFTQMATANENPANPSSTQVYLLQIQKVLQDNSVKELIIELGEEGLVFDGINYAASLRCLGYANIYALKFTDLQNKKVCKQSVRIGSCGSPSTASVVTEPSYEKDVRCKDM